MIKWTVISIIVLVSCGQRKDTDSATNDYPLKKTKELTAVDKQILDGFKTRRLSFDNYLKQEGSHKLLTCPSCGFPTVDERGNYEICAICDWEDDGQDDGQDDALADENSGGPNRISLTDSRLKIGRELQLLADSLNGKIVTEPEQFFNIFNEHEKRMQAAEEKIKDDDDRNGPAWENWSRTRTLIKRELITHK